MTTSPYSPSPAALREVVRWSNHILRATAQTCPVTRVMEREVLEYFTPLATNLRSLRGYFDCAYQPLPNWAGWPSRAKMALADLLDSFDRTKRSWGWLEYDQPEPGRSLAISASERLFDWRHNIPLLRCALAWVQADRGDPRTDPPEPSPIVRELAHEACSRCLEPESDGFQAARDFEGLYQRRMSSPCLGDWPPVLSVVHRARIEQAVLALQRHVESVEEDERARVPLVLPDPIYPEPNGNGNGTRKRVHRAPQPIGEV